MLLTGSDLFTTRHISSSTASVSGVRLATRSDGKFFASTGATFKAAAVPSSSVVPSGSARATVTAATVPPPPGRLSTMTGSLVASESASPTAWPITSAAPPAASGVTILIGRVGQSCAQAPDAHASSNAAAQGPPAALQIRIIRLPRAWLSVGPEYRICGVTPRDRGQGRRVDIGLWARMGDGDSYRHSSIETVLRNLAPMIRQ